MSDQNPDYVMYACFEKDEEHNVCRSVSISYSMEKIEEWKDKIRLLRSPEAKATPDKSVIAPKDTQASDDLAAIADPSEELSKLMSMFQESMSSFKPLVEVGMIMMPTVRSAFIHNKMYDNAPNDFDFLNKDNEFEVFGVNIDQYSLVQRHVSRLREFDKGITVLPGAILLSLVATFDSFIADTVRVFLKHNSKKITESSQTISIKELMSMGSFEDVISKIIDDEVDDLMRGSHDDQVKYIEKNFNISIREHYEDWNKFIEIFERRNLVAHGNCIVNKHYVQNCDKHGLKTDDVELGAELKLDARYLRRAADRLLGFGLSLMFVLWKKHFKETDEKAYDHLNDITYRLIRDDQPHVSAKILNLALYKQNPTAPDRTLKMMTINLANAHKKMKDGGTAKKIVDDVDWTATTADFQICIASLLGDVERFVELMPKVVQEKSIRKSDFREWPVFDWVREEEQVRKAFQELFGEELIRGSMDDQNMSDGNDKAAVDNDVSGPPLPQSVH